MRALVRKTSTDRDHFASNAVFMGTPVFLLFYAAQITAAALLASHHAGAAVIGSVTADAGAILRR